MTNNFSDLRIEDHKLCTERFDQEAGLNRVIVNGQDALMIEGMEKIFNALTGKYFSAEEWIICKEKLANYKNGLLAPIID